jgi:hypothetical protein
VRLLAENKAGTKPGRCPHCGRGVGYDRGQCRPTRDGDHWWCWTLTTIIYDRGKLTGPTPDPIGPAEQNAIDEWAPKIAGAATAVDQAMVIHAAVDGQARKALREAAQADITHVSGVSLSVDPTRIRNVNARERKRLQKAAEDALAGRRRAEEKLQKARRTLNEMQHNQDRARRAGRAQDERAARGQQEE